MASISANGSKGHHKFTLNVTESYVSGGADNYSDISFSFVLSPIQTGWDWYYSATVPVTYSITINGTTYTGNIMSYNGSSTVTVRSGSQRVTHNSDGSKSISFSFSVSSLDIRYLPGSCSSSGSMTLTKIPRYATVTQSMSSKTETAITMKWTANATIDYIWYSSNNGSTWTGINVTDGTSGSYTISGLSANTTYNIKTRVRRKDSQLNTDSSASSVETYAYPYCNSMPNFTIGNRVKLGFYNPLGRSIKVEILGADNSVIGSYTGTLNPVEGFSDSGSVDLQYKSIPNSKSGTYKVRVTYSSQVSTKTGGTYSVDENNCRPSIGSITYKDTNTKSVGITENNQQIVRSHSVVEYSASDLTAQKYASVKSCSVAVNGSSYNLILSGNTATGGNASINSGQDVAAVFTVTDSRGITATKSITVKMLDWYLPSAIISLQRKDNYYSQTFITVDAEYAYIDGKNQISIDYKARKVGTSAYTIEDVLEDNEESSFIADNNYAWEVVVTLVDSFGGRTTYNSTLDRGIPIIYFDKDLSSVGINCFPKEKISLEVNGSNILTSVMTRSLSASITDLMINSYTVIPLNISNSAGEKLSATEDGGIQIGENVNKILVSGRMFIETGATAGNRHIRIVKNSYTSNNTVGWNYIVATGSVRESVIITPIIADVKEDDVIYMMYYTPQDTDTIWGDAYGGRTSLTVETIS